ncbi:MAG: hypothetical protein EOM72_06050 [Opitutae bacterium]|nr:hypothetical protein [Opitutae bacterium]
MTSPGAPFPNADGLCHGTLQASGLPARVLAALRASGFATLGDLRQPLPPCDKLDADDRALLSRVAAYARATCERRPPPLNLVEWLALFLPPRLADVIHLHYGLREAAAALALHEAKLRDTGFQLGVTRERARQLLGLAFDALRQALPLFAAEPLFRAAEKSLRDAGGVLTPSALARLSAPDWGGASPVGAFLLLSQLIPGRLVLYRDFFSEFSAKLVERTEKALRDRLSAAKGLLPISEIGERLPKSARPPGVPSPEPLLLVLLRHLPDTFATRDGRAGLAARDGAELLRETLSATGEAPLRILLGAFNERLCPECRRGSGYIRDVLARDPLVRKTAPGRYALPGGFQTVLPI